MEYVDNVTNIDIIKVFPDPKLDRRRGAWTFDFDFHKFNINLT